MSEPFLQIAPFLVVKEPSVAPMPMTARRLIPLKNCQHGHTTVCEDERIVRCLDCDEKVDPIRALLRIAKEWDRTTWRHKHLVDECKHLRETIAELKKEERNTKARLRRLKR